MVTLKACCIGKYGIGKYGIGKYGKSIGYILNPGTSSQSEGYSSKWLVCGEPDYIQCIVGARTHQ